MTGSGNMQRILSSIFAVMLLLAGPALAAGGTAIPFAIGEWSPYTGSDLTGNGMAAEIVSAACNAVGLQAQFDHLPWKRAESVVAFGSHFGTFPFRTTEARKRVHWFSAPIFSSHFSMVMMKDSDSLRHLRISRREDLKGHRAGIVSGTEWVRTVLEKIGVDIEEAPTAEDNFRKLAAGRIDVYIDDEAVIRRALADTAPASPDSVVMLDEPFSDDQDFHIMVSRTFPDSGHLLARVNEGIEKIKRSGEYQRILKRYER